MSSSEPAPANPTKGGVEEGTAPATEAPVPATEAPAPATEAPAPATAPAEGVTQFAPEAAVSQQEEPAQPAQVSIASISQAVPIEVEGDGDTSDYDSALGDDTASVTTSLKSALLDYQYENGRRYQGYGKEKYFLPADETEADRLDLVSHMLNLCTGGKLHFAPIGDNPQRILDLGTGTGIWAIDMGDQYPSADVLGNDLADNQPRNVPPNVRFEIDDIEQEWIYSEGFDYIHMRMMGGALKDWPKLLRQAFKFTKPGGWVEFMDFTMTFNKASPSGHFERGCPVDKWTVELKDLMHGIGLDPEPGPKLLGWFKDTGFTNINQKTFHIPVGTWPKDKTMKEIGTINAIQFMENLEGFTLRPLTMKGWKREEIMVFIADVRKDFKNSKLQMQHDGYAVWAQKPLD